MSDTRTGSQIKADFTTGSIAKKLVSFMFPILGALFLQAMYGAVDLLIVGHFGTEAGISAVSSGSSIVNLAVFVIAGLSMGITVLLSRYIGERKTSQISEVLGGTVAFFSVVAVILTILMVVFARPLAILMQAPEEAVDLTSQYVRICGAGIIFVIAYNVISCIFRGIGNSVLPLIFVSIACVVNIFGDLLLVAVFDMDVAGAAIATIAAQAVSVILSLVIIRRAKTGLSLRKKDIRFNKEVRNFLKLGAPIALQELLTNLSFLALCAFINRLGLEQSSGYGIACKITSFVMLIPSSLMQSTASFIGQNVGAGKELRAKKAMEYGMLIGASIGVLVCLLTLFVPEFFCRIFSNNEAYVAQGADYLRGFAPEAIITCILFNFMGYFSGHGKTFFVMGQGLAQTFLVRLPMSYIMSIQPNTTLTLIGYAAPSATVFGILINFIYFMMFKRTLVMVDRPDPVTPSGESLKG